MSDKMCKHCTLDQGCQGFCETTLEHVDREGYENQLADLQDARRYRALRDEGIMVYSGGIDLVVLRGAELDIFSDQLMEGE